MAAGWENRRHWFGPSLAEAAAAALRTRYFLRVVCEGCQLCGQLCLGAEVLLRADASPGGRGYRSRRSRTLRLCGPGQQSNRLPAIRPPPEASLSFLPQHSTGELTSKAPTGYRCFPFVLQLITWAELARRFWWRPKSLPIAGPNERRRHSSAPQGSGLCRSWNPQEDPGRASVLCWSIFEVEALHRVPTVRNPENS